MNPRHSYSCTKCSKTGEWRYMIKHYIIEHVPAKKAPFSCTICGFKEFQESKIYGHVTDRHPGANASVIFKSRNPYKVEDGRDLDRIKQSEKGVKRKNDEEEDVSSSASYKRPVLSPSIPFENTADECGISLHAPDDEVEELIDENQVKQIQKIQDQFTECYGKFMKGLAQHNEKNKESVDKLVKSHDRHSENLDSFAKTFMQSFERQNESSEKSKEIFKELLKRQNESFGLLIKALERHGETLNKNDANVTKLIKGIERQSELLGRNDECIGELIKGIEKHSEKTEVMIRSLEKHGEKNDKYVEKFVRGLERHSERYEESVKLLENIMYKLTLALRGQEK